MWAETSHGRFKSTLSLSSDVIRSLAVAIFILLQAFGVWLCGSQQVLESLMKYCSNQRNQITQISRCFYCFNFILHHDDASPGLKITACLSCLGAAALTVKRVRWKHLGLTRLHTAPFFLLLSLLITRLMIQSGRVRWFLHQINQKQ